VVFPPLVLVNPVDAVLVREVGGRLESLPALEVGNAVPSTKKTRLPASSSIQKSVRIEKIRS